MSKVDNLPQHCNHASACFRLSHVPELSKTNNRIEVHSCGYLFSTERHQNKASMGKLHYSEELYHQNWFDRRGWCHWCRVMADLGGVRSNSSYEPTWFADGHCHFRVG